MPERTVVVTIHGIRTFGRWQERIQEIVTRADPEAEVQTFRYNYFSAPALAVPLLRNIVARRFAQDIQLLSARSPDASFVFIAHSFGTYVLIKGLELAARGTSLNIRAVILSGSVLPVGYRFDRLFRGHSLKRIINDCGTSDSILILSQLLCPGLGMAGRLGFIGLQGSTVVNRFFKGGHSHYFSLPTEGTQSFIESKWMPSILSDSSPKAYDERDDPTPLQGVKLVLIQNAEFLKVSLLVAIGAIVGSFGHNLYQTLATSNWRQSAIEVVAKLDREGFRAIDVAQSMQLLANAPDQVDRSSLERVVSFNVEGMQGLDKTLTKLNSRVVVWHGKLYQYADQHLTSVDVQDALSYEIDPDAKWLLLYTRDNRAVFWNVPNRKVTKVLQFDNSEHIRGATLHEEGPYLFTIETDVRVGDYNGAIDKHRVYVDPESGETKEERAATSESSETLTPIAGIPLNSGPVVQLDFPVSSGESAAWQLDRAQTTQTKVKIEAPGMESLCKNHLYPPAGKYSDLDQDDSDESYSDDESAEDTTEEPSSSITKDVVHFPGSPVDESILCDPSNWDENGAWTGPSEGTILSTSRSTILFRRMAYPSGHPRGTTVICTKKADALRFESCIGYDAIEDRYRGDGDDALDAEYRGDGISVMFSVPDLSSGFSVRTLVIYPTDYLNPLFIDTKLVKATTGTFDGRSSAGAFMDESGRIYTFQIEKVDQERLRDGDFLEQEMASRLPTSFSSMGGDWALGAHALSDPVIAKCGNSLTRISIDGSLEAISPEYSWRQFRQELFGSRVNGISCSEKMNLVAFLTSTGVKLFDLRSGVALSGLWHPLSLSDGSLQDFEDDDQCPLIPSLEKLTEQAGYVHRDDINISLQDDSVSVNIRGCTYRRYVPPNNAAMEVTDASLERAGYVVTPTGVKAIQDLDAYLQK